MADSPIHAQLRPDDALRAFKAACNKGPDVLFITESWFAPFERRLRACLESPIGADAAEALNDALSKRRDLEAAVAGLEAQPSDVEAPDIDPIAERFHAEALPPPPGYEPTETAGYIQFKAFLYLAVGPDAYRRSDHFGCPPATWSEALLEVVRSGCEQLLAWRGFTEDRPLQDLGIRGFYALLQLFHFEVSSQALLQHSPPGKHLDQMRMRHVVSGDEITLYNLVDSPMAEKPSVPCPYCGAALRTPKSKQCRVCRSDWHDSENVIRRRG